MKIYNKIKSIVNRNQEDHTIEIQDDTLLEAQVASSKQVDSEIKRTDVINYLIKEFNFKSYLEIGVRNPDDNFSLIEIEKKYCRSWSGIRE